MTEYTPTTKEVRAAYSEGNYLQRQAFDRWLVEHEAEVIANLKNGLLPRGYMIVSVRDLTDSVIRALKEVTK